MGSHPDLEKPIAGRVSESGLDPDAQPVRVVNYHRVILFVAGVYLAITFIDAITQALLLFLAAFLIAIILNAPVRWLENHGVKRGISAAGVALIVLGSLAATGFLAGPPIVQEASLLIQEGPDRVERLRARATEATADYPALQQFLQSEAMSAENLLPRVQTLLPRIGRYTLNVFGAAAAALFVLVIALYTLAAPKSLLRGLITAVPPSFRSPATHALTRIVGQLEAYALATLLLMAIVGVMCGLGLWFLGVPNPLIFGLIAGFGEAIPTIGPILSAVPPMLVALADQPSKALWVAGLFLVVQQVENNLLVPWIMARNLNLHPISILFFVLALGVFVGPLGALLAVPTAIIVKTCYEEFYADKRAPHPDALDEAAEQILRGGARPGG